MLGTMFEIVGVVGIGVSALKARNRLRQRFIDIDQIAREADRRRGIPGTTGEDVARWEAEQRIQHGLQPDTMYLHQPYQQARTLLAIAEGELGSWFGGGLLIAVGVVLQLLGGIVQLVGAATVAA